MSPPRILRGALESLLEAAAVGRWSAQRAQQQARGTSPLHGSVERQHEVTTEQNSQPKRHHSTAVEEARMIRLASLGDSLSIF
jgi:hypothetical protein